MSTAGVGLSCARVLCPDVVRGCRRFISPLLGPRFGCTGDLVSGPATLATLPPTAVDRVVLVGRRRRRDRRRRRRWPRRGPSRRSTRGVPGACSRVLLVSMLWVIAVAGLLPVRLREIASYLLGEPGWPAASLAYSGSRAGSLSTTRGGLANFSPPPRMTASWLDRMPGRSAYCALCAFWMASVMPPSAAALSASDSSEASLPCSEASSPTSAPPSRRAPAARPPKRPRPRPRSKRSGVSWAMCSRRIVCDDVGADGGAADPLDGRRPQRRAGAGGVRRGAVRGQARHRHRRPCRQ